MDAETLRALTGCNLDQATSPRRSLAGPSRARVHGAAEAFVLPGSWVAWRASGTLAVDPSNASSTGLLDPRSREWSPEACDTFEVDPERLAPVQRPDAVLGPSSDGCRRRRADRDARRPRGGVTRWPRRSARGVVEPGVVCDVMGTPSRSAPSSPNPRTTRRASSSFTPTPTRRAGLLENPGGSPAALTAGSATSSAAPEAARRRRAAPTSTSSQRARRASAPGAGGVSWVPALAGAMAPEWNSRRAAWLGMTAAHGRATSPARCWKARAGAP
jgi:sugar (pentulose or hexulose) kinase